MALEGALKSAEITSLSWLGLGYLQAGWGFKKVIFYQTDERSERSYEVAYVGGSVFGPIWIIIQDVSASFKSHCFLPSYSQKNTPTLW